MKLGDWLDERLGHRAFFERVFRHPIPGGARWSYAIGGALVFAVVMEIVTGVVLATVYTPSVQTAWSSVAYIEFTLSMGWLVRGMHHFGSQAIVVLSGLYLFRSAISGAYRKPHELTWITGIVLFMIALAFPPTGNLLRYDQHGFWSVKAETGYLGTIPIIGGFLQRASLGGDDLGQLTIARFYILHVAVLPALLLAFVALHSALIRRNGHALSPGRDSTIIDAWFPKQAFRDLVVALGVLVVVVALTIRAGGAPLEAPADPASDFTARPDWYFLPLYSILKHLRGPIEPLGVIGVPLVVFGFLFAIPFLDRSKRRGGSMAMGALVAAMFLGAFAAIGASIQGDAHDEAYQKARAQATKQAARAVELFKKGVPPEGPLAMLKNDPETRGEALFVASCASCHRLGEFGPEKGKDTAPDLTGWGTKKWVLALFDDPDSDEKFGKTPFKGMMLSLVHPPKDPEGAKNFKAVTAADQDAMASFLEAMGKGESGKGMPGEKLVSQRCTGCHRLDGDTLDNDAMGPELRGWASPKWTSAQIANPGNDKITYPKAAMADDLKGHMPRFDDKFTPEEMSLLTTWMLGAARR